MTPMNEHPVWRFADQMPEGHEFEIYHAVSTSPQPRIYHSHPYYEIYFILRGSVRVIVEDQDLSPSLGEALIYPPHCMHRVIHTDPGQPYERFYIYLSREFLQSVSTPEYSFPATLDSLTSGGRRCLRPGRLIAAGLVSQADEIISSARDDTPAGRLCTRCRMILFLVQLMKVFTESTAPSAESASPRMSALIRYIDDNAAQPLTLDSLEAVFGLSKYALLHEFKDYTGMPIHQYILTRRVLLAAQLIRGGAKPREACEKSGFADYTSFYRAFRARMGKSPAQYARSLPPGEDAAPGGQQSP